jgi:hypothetical protein
MRLSEVVLAEAVSLSEHHIGNTETYQNFDKQARVVLKLSGS